MRERFTTRRGVQLFTMLNFLKTVPLSIKHTLLFLILNKAYFVTRLMTEGGETILPLSFGVNYWHVMFNEKKKNNFASFQASTG